MTQFKRSSVFLSKYLLGGLIGAVSLFSHAQINIDIKQSHTKLIYPQAVRLSQVLQDAQSSLDYLPYRLGISLTNPDRKEEVATLKQSLLNDLHAINSTDAIHLSKQIAAVNFAYREKLETDFIRVVTTPKQDPLLTQNYTLSLPKRPDHIVFIDTNEEALRKVKIKANQDLTGYLSELASNPSPESIWIIQANQDVYQPTHFQRKDDLYFLSPGAIVYIGLKNLPEQYQDLNSRIAHLLTFSVDL